MGLPFRRRVEDGSQRAYPHSGPARTSTFGSPATGTKCDVQARDRSCAPVLGRLHWRERRELLLYAHDFSYHEIANLTGTSYTAVNASRPPGPNHLRAPDGQPTELPALAPPTRGAPRGSRRGDNISARRWRKRRASHRGDGRDDAHPAHAPLKRRNPHVCGGSPSGASRARTGDLLHAMQAYGSPVFVVSAGHSLPLAVGLAAAVCAEFPSICDRAGPKKAALARSFSSPAWRTLDKLLRAALSSGASFEARPGLEPGTPRS
jgi:hypothetical protein